MFSFQDINEDNVSLRPEATAGIMRAIQENTLLRSNPILKVYTVGPMFRRERPSKARYRQFYQINAELVGDDSPYNDADVIVTAVSILKAIGIESTLEINSIGCLECRAAYRTALKDYLSMWLSSLCEDCQRRFVTNPMRTLDCKEDRCRAILGQAPLILDYLDESCRSQFEAVLGLLDLAGISYQVNPKIVRGLDYYSRTAFEFTTELLGQSKAIGGGGRYDGLLKSIGGPDVSGIGFAFGIERLIESMMRNISSDRSLVYIAALGEEARRVAFPLIQNLRKYGILTETRFSGSLKSQMKNADKLNAAFVVMIGDNELSSGEYTVRDMKGSEQIQIAADQVISFLSERCNFCLDKDAS